VLLAMVPLVIGPLVIGQRASVVHFAVTTAVVGVVMAGPTWRRRMRVRPTQLLLVGIAVLTIGCLALLPGLSQGEVLPKPVSEAVDGTFGGAGNTQSADARVNKWDAGTRMVKARPLLGWGLGAKHQYFAPGINGVGVFRKGSTFDNIVFDLLVRSGIPGLLFFLTAMGLSIRDGWRVWLRYADPRVAALSLGLTMFIVGMLAKGAVESVLEKVVLAVALGLSIGAIASARAEVEAEAGTERVALDMTAWRSRATW
jgi:O-antigen ligase